MTPNNANQIVTGPRRAGRAERGFVVLVLFFSTGAFLNLLPGQSPGGRLVANNTLIQMVWAALYLGIFVLLLRHCRGFLRGLAGDPWLLTLLALAFLSTAWSGDPGFTLKRSIGLLGTYLCAVYLVMRYDLRTQLKLVAWALGSAALLSAPFGLLGIGNCDSGTGLPRGDWCGVYPHKNGLGAMMALSCLVFVLMARLEHSRRWAMRLLAGLSIGLLLLSDSVTSMVALLGVTVALAYCKYVHGNASRAIRAGVAAVIAGGLGLYWTVHHLGTVTEIMGRNATLTGRLQLWVLSFVMALQRPWLGYGYGAFWLGREGPSARVIRALGNWHAYYAHNGLLELWLDLGLVGVAAFVIGCAIYAVRAFRLFQSNRGAEYVWPLAFLVFTLLRNLAESTLLAPDSISWLLYVAAALLVSPTLQHALVGEYAPKRFPVDRGQACTP